MMELARLAADLTGHQVLGPGAVQVVAIHDDSRQVTPGSLFVAVPGYKADGHDYIGEALAQGATALAVQSNRREKWTAFADEKGVPVIIVPDTRRALAVLAAAFYGYPGKRLQVIGVTGTDGKTSVVHLVAHVLESLGWRTGLISTVGGQIGGQATVEGAGRTTPEAPEVQAMLARMVEAGCHCAVVEATSHGLALHRLDECAFDVAVFTNIGLDHIDFHGSQEAYLAAKGRLLLLLKEEHRKAGKKTAVLNADDDAFLHLRRLTKARVLTYGVNAQADVQGGRIADEGWGSRFRLVVGKRDFLVRLQVPGVFNVYNALAAVAVGLSLGAKTEEMIPGLESWPGVPGRMERIDEGQPFALVVDFAHAPDGLRRVLQFLRARAGGRLIVVFGSIGERDKERRFPMGRIAAELADCIIVTDDNPYGEDREAIIEEIAAGLLAGGRREDHDFVRVPDRREAIGHALSMAGDDDVVLLAGKGHETRVYLGDTWYECDDRGLTRQLLRGL
jgi:UDP-N-acetylmuramoyl-L-alanyl-D-glutamate--2,6-diaminopimelate ligase